MYTVKDEIIKYLINEGYIKTTQNIKSWKYSKILKLYLSVI